MILGCSFCIRPTSPRFVILKTSDKDARRISAPSVATELSSLPGCKLWGNP